MHLDQIICRSKQPSNTPIMLYDLLLSVIHFAFATQKSDIRTLELPYNLSKLALPMSYQPIFHLSRQVLRQEDGTNIDHSTLPISYDGLVR